MLNPIRWSRDYLKAKVILMVNSVKVLVISVIQGIRDKIVNLPLKVYVIAMTLIQSGIERVQMIRIGLVRGSLDRFRRGRKLIWERFNFPRRVLNK